jgi:hypothetical protein
MELMQVQWRWHCLEALHLQHNHSIVCIYQHENDDMMLRCDGESRSICAHVLQMWLHAV